MFHGPHRHCEERSDEAIQGQSRRVCGLLRCARNDGREPLVVYAPIAIFGSASALAFISFSARRYSTGITLRNFGSHVFQLARISAARFDSVSLAWRVIRTCSRSI